VDETDAELGPREYRDLVNVSGIIASLLIGGAALVLIILLRLNEGMPLLALLFALLFPLAALGAIFVALTSATLTYDRSGWRYRREVLGHTLETEEGKWSDIARTNYRQWYVGGKSGSSLFGELSLIDSTGRTVLRGRTQFYARGDPSNGHSVAKRQIGLAGPNFDTFVRLIDSETPQLDYIWFPAEVVGGVRIGGIFWDPGPPRFVKAPRQKGPSAERLETERSRLPHVWHGSSPPAEDPSPD
jgi:hypothetical protein